MLTRRRVISLSAAQAVAPTLFARAARAQTPRTDFPNRPVRLIVPVAAGGPTDLVARMLAERLSKTGPKRDAAAPDVPTIAEAGVPGYDVTAWQALFAPARTPPDIVRRLSADTNAALADPAIKEKLAQTGYVAQGSSPEELDKLLRAEIAKWSAVIRSVGIKID